MPSRNVRCHCGSGKRFKDCHGALRAVGQPAADAIASDLERAMAHHRQGRLAEADAAYRGVLRVSPSHFDALHMLGVVAHQRDANDEAVVLLRQAIAADPRQAAPHSNLGLALHALRELEEALASYERALMLAPDYAEAHSNRGNVLRDLGRCEEAVASYERALALNPQNAQALSNLGNALIELSRHAAAAECFARLLAIAPDHDWALGYLLQCRMHCCAWEDFESLARRVETAVAQGKRAITPFAFLAVADSPDLQRRCSRTYASTSATERPMRRPSPVDDTQRKLRIAYLSGDFHDHATAYLIAGLFDAHDRTRFEVTAVSFGPDSHGPMRRRLAKSVDRFVDVRANRDLDVARMLRAWETDIAIDLKGLTHGARPDILAGRPVSIQVGYLGYPGTMGVDYIDYLVADAFVVPAGDEVHYTESIVRLPGSYQINDRARAIAEATPSRAALGLPETAFVFCCFNNNYKITPRQFDIWMRLLQRVPDSVLWLLEDNADAVSNLRREAQSRGVARERLVFAPRVPIDEHLARHRCADLFLDTLPYNAHTTASDALWAGLPVVTCAGASFPGRVAGSLLHAVGLPELVISDQEGYEALAVRLAQSPPALAELRERLHRNRLVCPLFDTDRFRRNIEAAYLFMWDRHRRGEPPVGFGVDAHGATLVAAAGSASLRP